MMNKFIKTVDGELYLPDCHAITQSGTAIYGHIGTDKFLIEITKVHGDYGYQTAKDNTTIRIGQIIELWKEAKS